MHESGNQAIARDYYEDRPLGGMKGEPAFAPVMQEYGNLGKSLAVLGETFDALRVRLEPVTGPSRPTAHLGAEKNPNDNLSPLASSLRDETERVYRLNNAMKDLMERIEL